MKNLFTFLLFAILLLTVASCNRDNDNGGTPPVIPVSGITLNQISATLVVGDTLFLSATVQPADATNQTVTWVSNNPSVATVNNSNGVVTAISSGEATIIATTEDGNHTAICVVTVNPAPIPVTSVTLPATFVVAVGGTVTLTATVLPEDATNKNVTWQSDNTVVATVNNTGVVTGISAGTAIITVTTEDGNHTATAKIDVYEILSNRCNTRIPGWGESLGTVTFHSQGHNVVISGNGITQTWSGAVTATNCQKTTFAGASSNSFNADCCSNPNFPGDLFSWCAVVRFADVLCPYPWRVPTNEDFRDLDIALGGNGSGSPMTVARVNDEYITRWGGAFGGGSVSGSSLWGQGVWGSYWSQSESSAMSGRTLSFGTGGDIGPQIAGSKDFGFSVRCVR